MTNAQSASEILAACDDLMDTLDAQCCAPGRSPRMEALRGSLADISTRLDAFDGSSEMAKDVINHIEDAGAQIGSLQVSCCAPGRMPLYEELLTNLMKVQRSTKRSAKLAHDGIP